MNKTGKIVTVIFLIVAVVIVVAVKQNRKANSGAVVDEEPANFVVSSEVAGPETSKDVLSKALPRLVDLGADKCIPCKMMAPILVELKSEYDGRLIVDFIDVWKNPDEGPKYGIKLIPTQIFFDASGKELFRHEGFISKEDILAKWKEFGVELVKAE
jgi:thioredoxin 1